MIWIPVSKNGLFVFCRTGLVTAAAHDRKSNCAHEAETNDASDGKITQFQFHQSEIHSSNLGDPDLFGRGLFWNRRLLAVCSPGRMQRPGRRTHSWRRIGGRRIGRRRMDIRLIPVSECGFFLFGIG